jgi:hypothetical protein
VAKTCIYIYPQNRKTGDPTISISNTQLFNLPAPDTTKGQLKTVGGNDLLGDGLEERRERQGHRSLIQLFKLIEGSRVLLEPSSQEHMS